MGLKRRNTVNPTFSMSSMTDIVFLLLIFFMITSTLVSPNAIKLNLPQSNQQTTVKAIKISITSDLRYYVEDKRVGFDQLEATLRNRIGDQQEPYISLHVDENVPMKEVVKVMNIAKNNDYKVILATRAR